MTRMTHPAAARISSWGMAPMTTIDRRSFISSAVKRAKSAVGWLGIATKERVTVSSAKPFLLMGRSSTLTSTAVTMGVDRSTRRSITVGMSGHAMTMAMVYVKFIATVVKEQAPRSAHSYDRFAACIKPISNTTSQPTKR